MDSFSVRNTATEVRRRTILQAALEAYSAKGIAAMTMEDIRILSGASTGSIYHHFENKEKLALALYLDGVKDMHKHLLDSIMVEHPYDGINALIHVYIRWHAHNPELGQYLLQAGNAEYLADQVKSIRQSPNAFSLQFQQWLDPFIEAGLIKKFPSSVYFPLIVGPSKEFVRRWLYSTRNLEELDECSKVLAEAAWMAIAVA
jgi:AcrR family transcriptional regulator